MKVACTVWSGGKSGGKYAATPHISPRDYLSLFFDCDARLPTKEEQETDLLDWIGYSGYILTSKTLIAIFDTMDDAKKRAYTQYRHHYGYVLSHFVDDVESETQKHTVVE